MSGRDECSKCGGYRAFGLEHVCRPVGEKRLREIIREELAAAMFDTFGEAK